jgi:hypothetical protein
METRADTLRVRATSAETQTYRKYGFASLRTARSLCVAPLERVSDTFPVTADANGRSASVCVAPDGEALRPFRTYYGKKKIKPKFVYFLPFRHAFVSTLDARLEKGQNRKNQIDANKFPGVLGRSESCQTRVHDKMWRPRAGPAPERYATRHSSRALSHPAP